MPTSDAKVLDGHPVDVLADIPDFRDRYYEPALVQLRTTQQPGENLIILNQGQEGACTGFGLAAVINKLNQARDRDVQVSARMLYEMARKFDRWPGEGYSGSSCRGAIKGWYNMGVCSEREWPYVPGEDGAHLTVARAKDARANTIGAYYRIRKHIVDMHAALNEVGTVYASATVHEGWRGRSVHDGRIDYEPPMRSIGGHAFAIVGYDETGFWVQNSWGPGWGERGLAHWRYEDWSDNVRDAWVLRLALPTPQLWTRTSGSGASAERAELFSSGPRRDEIAGHFVHIDDGEFHDEGRYWSTLADVKATARLVARSADYDHLLVYAHGGLNSIKASATRIAAMKPVFKKNRIYPFHFMYDTGLLEEILDLVIGKRSDADELAGGFSDWWDRRVEQATRRPGRALWREMKSDAEHGFKVQTRPGTQTMKAFLSAFSGSGAPPKRLHLVGHSTGAILLGHLLHALSQLGAASTLRIGTASLLAPAATMELFDRKVRPHLDAGARRFGVDDLRIYNLDDELERDDTVATVYRKSLLYLVSNAFEEEREAPLLGMQAFARDMQLPRRTDIVYSRGKNGAAETESTSHGGFDNDPATLNDVLRRVLGGAPDRPFTSEDLDY